MSSTLTKERVKGIWNHEFNNTEFIDQIKNVYNMFLASNYGPNSGLVAIQNSAGRYVYSASSSVILENLQFFHPVYKFINALINAQNKLYGTHGLYIGLLCSGLLYRFMQLEEDCISFRLIKELSDWVINELLQELQGSQIILLKVELYNLDHILCIVKSILNSKVYNLLLKEETDHFCLKIMQCFVKSIPHDLQQDFSHLHISTIEGSSTMNSQIYEGILYRETDFLLDDLQDIMNIMPTTNLRIIIFNVPLSSNQGETCLVKWSGKDQIGKEYDRYFVNELKNILMEKRIHIIANQKYIDYTVKFELEKAGYLVLERLGTRLASSLTLMCKCNPVTSLSEITDREIGNVHKINAVDIAGKTYIHLMSENSAQCLTFILSGLNGHILEYLKEVVESCVNLLQHSVINEPSVVFGAGCLEAFIALKLMDMKQEHIVKLSKQLDSSSAKINKVFKVFIETFLQLCIKPSGGNTKKLVDYYIDSSWNHLWIIDDLDLENVGVLKKTPFTHLPAQRLSSSLAKSIACTCLSVMNSELPEDTYFISLSSLKNDTNITNQGFSDNPNTKLTPLHISESEAKLLFKKYSIVDYWPAKLNSIRLAFDGLSELLQIGYCFFDK